MGNITCTEAYKQMESRVKEELEQHIHKCLYEYITDEKNVEKHKELDRTQFAQTSVISFFNNFHFKLPDFKGFETAMAPDFAQKREVYKQMFKEKFQIKKDAKNAIIESGLNPQKVKDLTERLQNDRTGENYIQLLDYTFPVYITLRMKGYTHKELWGE